MGGYGRAGMFTHGTANHPGVRHAEKKNRRPNGRLPWLNGIWL